MFAQRAKVREAPQVDMPSQVDSNSPSYWRDGEFHLLNSTGGNPTLRSSGADQFHLGAPQVIRFNHYNPWPTWIEALWVDPAGPIFAWYHQEHWNVCPGSRLAIPQIGAAVSFDGGVSFQDLGAILESGDPYSCGSQNGYFAGGHGDFSVIPDRDNKFFYFLFSNYAGRTRSQGVAIARMAFDQRYNPSGNVWKYFEAGWTEPGLRGRITAVFPAKVNWQAAETDALWGPSVHWNTYLDSYVMLMNHSCCTPGFTQEGIYASFTSDLSDPKSWTTPKKILSDTGWYPQVIGSGQNGTDGQAGRVARLYVYGHSRWEIVFRKPTEPEADPAPQ